MGYEFFGALFDLTKAFDDVGPMKLRLRAIDSGYPSSMPCCQFASSFDPASSSLARKCPEWHVVGLGILAGCLSATRLLKALLLPVLLHSRGSIESG